MANAKGDQDRKPSISGAIAVAGAVYIILLGMVWLLATSDTWLHVDTVARFITYATVVYIGVVFLIVWSLRNAPKNRAPRSRR